MKHISYSIDVRKIIAQGNISLDEYANSSGDVYYVLKAKTYSDGKRDCYTHIEFSSQELATIEFNKMRGVK